MAKESLNRLISLIRTAEVFGDQNAILICNGSMKKIGSNPNGKIILSNHFF